MDEPVIFSVLGDAPDDSVETGIVQRNFDDHDLYSPADFLVHLGDIKHGTAPCDEFWYQNMATMLRSLSVPAFIVPGDNDWTDCLDRVVAWQYWTTHLMGIENSFCGVPDVQRQSVRPENFAFVFKGVLFMGINLVGGGADRSVLLDDADWVHQQLADHAALVRAAVVLAHAGPGSNHDTFFDRFVPDAIAFAKPVLYAHGDGHSWKADQPFPASNVFRIQVDRGIVPPVQVAVETDGTFRYERNPWPTGTLALDRPPCTDAGPDLIVPEHGTARLQGRASDDGEPLPTHFDVHWSLFDGPGEVTFADSTTPVTAAIFSGDGTYLLRLTASDGLSVASDEMQVTVGGVGPNDPPVTQRDFYEVDVDHTLWVAPPGVLANDTDGNGDVLAAVLVAPPSHGSLVLASDGSFTYVPTPGHAGLDRFVYKASDTVADVEAEAWLGVGGAVQTFVVAADAKVRSSQPTNNYGNTSDLRVELDAATFHSYLKFNIANVGSVRGGALRMYVQSGSADGGTIHAVANNYEGTTTPWTETGITWSNAPAITGPAIASAGPVQTGQLIDWPLGRAIRGTGTWSFGLQNTVPDGVYYGSRESSHPPELFLAVLPVGADLRPVAAADAFAVDEDEQLTVATPGVLANDTDEDADPLSAIMTSPPTHGQVTLAADGSFVYMPAPDFAGTDAFAYLVDDGRGGSDAGIVTLTVNPVNDPPRVRRDVYEYRCGENLAVATPGVLVNDVDVEGDPLAATLVSGPSHGSISLAADGSFVYQPGAGCAATTGGGTDVFVYAANDGETQALAAVTVRSVRSEAVAQVFAPAASQEPHASKAAAAGTPDVELPLVATKFLTFQITGLGPKVEQATLRLYVGATATWLERDVTPAVTGVGDLRLELAALVPAGVAVDLGPGGHEPELIVVTSEAPDTGAGDAGEAAAPVENAAATRTQLEGVAPNPFFRGVRIEYNLAEPQDVDVVIYNARGQRVRTLAAEHQVPGRRILFWDGTDTHAARVPAGIYFLRARFGNQIEKRKLVVAR